MSGQRIDDKKLLKVDLNGRLINVPRCVGFARSYTGSYKGIIKEKLLHEKSNAGLWNKTGSN